LKKRFETDAAVYFQGLITHPQSEMLVVS